MNAVVNEGDQARSGIDDTGEPHLALVIQTNG